MGRIRHFFFAKFATRRWRQCSETSHSSSVSKAQATPIHVFLLRFYQASCFYGDWIATNRRPKFHSCFHIPHGLEGIKPGEFFLQGSFVVKQCRFWVVFVNRCKYRRWHKQYVRCNFVHEPWLSSSPLIWKCSRPFYWGIVVLDHMCCYKI